MAKANQTFFIPEGIRRLRLSETQPSGELARVLLKLRISTFGDLAGTSLRDFQRVSDISTALFLEIGRLIQRARQGDFAGPPAQHVRLKQDSSDSRVEGTLERAANADRRTENRRINAAAVSESQPDETIFIPLEARGKLLAAFPSSVRLKHILGSKNFRLVGDPHGLTFSEFLSYRNCGKKTVVELRESVRSIQHGHHTAASTVTSSRVVTQPDVLSET